MFKQQYRRSVILFLLIAFFVPAAYADKLASIIIDDLGNNLEYGNMAIALPGSITLAFLPHTVFAAELADRAHNSGKEIMLHLPNTPIVAASGVAGIGNSDRIVTKQIGNLHMVYDEHALSSDDDVLLAPKVCLMANWQANIVLEILVGDII